MNEKADIWMPMYIGDYLSDTSRLTTEQHGAYLLLLFDYWKNGPLPDDPAILQQISKLSSDAWSRHQATLLKFFRKGPDGLFHQKRADVEIDKWSELKKRSVNGGLKRASQATRHTNGRFTPASVQPDSQPKHQPDGQQTVQHNHQPNSSPKSSTSPLPLPSPLPLSSPSPPSSSKAGEEKAPRSGDDGTPAGSPAAGFSFHDEAEMVATAVVDQTGLTGWHVRDQIVKQAERQLRLSADTGKPVTKEILLAVMVKNYRLYDACVQQDRIRLPVTPERFFSDGLWKNQSKWGFKKGASADGIEV